MLGRESFKEYDDMLFEALNSFYRNVLKSKFHKYNRVYGNIEVNTNGSNNHNMIFDEYSFDIINNSKRGLFVKTIKFTDLYYKKVKVSDIDREKFDGIGEYIYSVVLMGFNLDEKYLDEKFKGGNRKRYWVDEGLFKDLSEKFEFKESILNEAENEYGVYAVNGVRDVNGVNSADGIDGVKKERLRESQRKWDRGIFEKYEFFLREEDMEYLLKGIFEDRIKKERVRVWCDGEDMSGGNEDGDMDEDVGDMSEGTDVGDDGRDDGGDDGGEVEKKVERVKPYAFLKKIVLRLEEGCNWAGRREGENNEDKDGRDNEEIFSKGCFLDERDVLRFDKEGVPLEKEFEWKFF